MTRLDEHVRFDELAVGYALRALEPEDEQLFRAHLAGCARCERALDEHAGALAQLAYAPDAAEPPPSLLEGIRAGVLASGRGASFPADAGPTAPVPEPVQPEPVQLADVRRRRDASRLRRSGTLAGIAAAAALVIGLGVWNVGLQQDRDEQADFIARIAAAVSQLRDEDTETVPLRGDSGEVVAVALVRGDEMSLVLDGLPVNDDATTYVIWGESSLGDKRAVGAFDVTKEGMDVRDGLRLQDSVTDVTRYLVTQEQGDSAPATPTLPVLAVGTV
ncbi:hypothetical protein BH24ACT10_BH24ACT10_13430 [soil metagenome]